MSNGNPSAEQAIIDLTVTYCWALDSKNFEALASVFAQDATTGLGGSQSGIAEIIERVSSALARFPTTQHIVTNHVIAINGDAATSRCYVQVQHVWESGDLYTVGGRYEDQLSRTPAGWRITHRDLVVMWTAPQPKQTKGS